MFWYWIVYSNTGCIVELKIGINEGRMCDYVYFRMHCVFGICRIDCGCVTGFITEVDEIIRYFIITDSLINDTIINEGEKLWL